MSTTGGEAERIAFLEQRDGKVGALAFAIQTLDVYRKSTRPWRDEHGRIRWRFLHDPVYRASFIHSMIFFRNYIRLHSPKP